MSNRGNIITAASNENSNFTTFDPNDYQQVTSPQLLVVGQSNFTSFTNFDQSEKSYCGHECHQNWCCFCSFVLEAGYSLNSRFAPKQSEAYKSYVYFCANIKIKMELIMQLFALNLMNFFSFILACSNSYIRIIGNE